jgi:hypothetical protein
MNTITKSDYHVSILVQVSVEDAFQGICRVREWWTTNFTGIAEKKGGRFFVPFGETSAHFEVTEMEPHRKIKWHVLENGREQTSFGKSAP